MRRQEPSNFAILLSHLGVTRHQLIVGMLLIALFEATIIGLALGQAFAERGLAWPPLILFTGVWVLWTAWHSWLFPRNRLRYLKKGDYPYRRAFVFDIYPWVSLGFSQMWRPLINGETLSRVVTAFAGGPFPLHPASLAIGLTLCVVSLGIIIHAIKAIGIHNAAFLREFVEHDTFVPIQSGIYGAIMHPLFWSGIAYSCGLAIAVSTSQALSMAAINAMYGLLYNRLENRRLRRVFGASYEAYMARVPSVIPIRMRR